MFAFKCVTCGNTGAGKSCLVNRFVRQVWTETESTIGAAFLTRNLILDDCNVKCEIWDTAGQERYRSLAPMYYRGAQAAVVVFDVTVAESFDGAKAWVKELQRRAEPGIVIALAGNKIDLAHKRKVDADEVYQYAKEQGIMYFETSAKDATNVETMFTEVALRVPRRNVLPQSSSTVQLGTASQNGPITNAARNEGRNEGCC